MKEYDRIVLWTDYFDSAISRSGGRRVSLSSATKSPTLEELAEAARKLGYDVETVKASHPKRSPTRSGYVSIPRTKPKTQVITEIAQMLPLVRGDKRQPT